MKKPNIKLLIALFFIFPLGIYFQDRGVRNLTISKLPAKEKRWALIIGVDTYQKDITPLQGTVNDAKALRDVLIKSAGFTDERIILMTTDSNDADLIPTRGNIIDQLDKLQRVVPADGLILFSFSGHGVSIGSDAFIVPADGRIYQNVELMRERAIDVLRIKRAIQDTKVKQVIMFLDACRNDPVKGKGGGDNNLTTAYTKGFSFNTRNQNIEAYATLYATSFGDRAYEFLDKKTNKYRGYFSYAIEEGLKGSAANDKGEVTLAGLIRYIEDTVKERVRINENQKQIPYPTTEGFRNSDLVIAVAGNRMPIRSNEEIYWQLIENSTDAIDFEDYLARIKNGEFKGIYKASAELKLRRLKNNSSEAKPSTKPIKLPNFEMIQLPAGDFWTGATENIPIKIDKSFYLGKYETTQNQWEAVMGENPSKFSNCGNCPVERVSWNEVNEFIDKLNSSQKEYKYRLPSEYEWEYACRADTTSRFNTGRFNIDTNQANFGNNTGKTVPVDSYKPNNWGFYNMHGNVSEWTINQRSGYGESRVVRGGSWIHRDVDLPCKNRMGEQPSVKNQLLGFRLAADKQ